jgi:hypothetical protein
LLVHAESTTRSANIVFFTSLGAIAMKRIPSLLARSAAAVLLLSTLSPVLGMGNKRCEERVDVVENALVQLAADRIGAILGAVADSTRALGNTYERLDVAQGKQTPPESKRWQALRTTDRGCWRHGSHAPAGSWS